MADGDEGGERKERVLHTRVPASLDRHLKHRARTLGMSVSTVVRHVLLNTFGLVEDIVTDSTNIALSIAGQRMLPRADRDGAHEPADGEGIVEILGWQEVVLNRNAVCDRCNVVLRKGVRAALGVSERPGPQTILCRRCLEQVAAPDERGQQGGDRWSSGRS
ncbi:MAG TPA: hypothetical protein VJ829_15970 [Candidatus Binatia bacterium]|nr:hypothetical protein [Candidatus Binatia bacterium]